MEVSSGPRATGWQGAYVPQLKFRNPVPSDDGLQHRNSHVSPEPVQDRSGLSIREIRLAMSPQGQQQGSNPSPPRSLMPPSVENSSRTTPGKKKSRFGGLFAVKEPTQVALNQVAAQIMAQHGSTTAGKVPNVSMEKMPQHVPKVNAKWDGIPDAVKQREKREKERARTATGDSMTDSTLRSRSSEQSRRQLETRASNNSGSSHSDRTKSQHSNSRKHDSFAPNPHRFYAQSVNSSGDLAAQQRPEEEDSRPSSVFSHPPSLQSTSSKSIADAGVSPDDMHSPPKPKASAVHQRSLSHPKSERKRASLPPPIQTVPEQTKQFAKTTLDRAVLTQHSTGHGAVAGRSRYPAPQAPEPEIVSKPMPKAAIRNNAAFLAGEAQEFQVPDDDEEDDHSGHHAPGALSRPPARFADLEKRPDSSRDRLGLRASMIVKGDRLWDPRSDYPYDRPPSADDSTNAQLKPKKTISKAFGSLLKKEV